MVLMNTRGGGSEIHIGVHATWRGATAQDNVSLEDAAGCIGCIGCMHAVGGTETGGP